jgi:hypothetical protein
MELAEEEARLSAQRDAVLLTIQTFHKAGQRQRFPNPHLALSRGKRQPLLKNNGGMPLD